MSHFFKKNRSAGFTLTELLVSLGIAGVILTVVVLNQRSYTDAATLASLADEMSLTISQAQAYGIGVRELAPGSSDFSSAYGLSVSILSSGSNESYLFFADRNGNEYYDGDWSCPIGGASECLEKVNFIRGNYIESFCLVRSSGSDQCGQVSRVDVSFLRPNTTARITLFNNGGQEYSPANVIGVRINLMSLSGLTRSVIIYETGHVSVQ